MGGDFKGYRSFVLQSVDLLGIYPHLVPMVSKA